MPRESPNETVPPTLNDLTDIFQSEIDKKRTIIRSYINITLNILFASLFIYLAYSKEATGLTNIKLYSFTCYFGIFWNIILAIFQLLVILNMTPCSYAYTISNSTILVGFFATLFGMFGIRVINKISKE